MAKLLSPDALVAVWVTNRPKYKQFLIDKLFSSWNLELVGEWYWMKMTTIGQPVMPLDSTHRKPYELLLVARNKASSSVIDVPEKLVFASVASQHSRKPPLNGKTPDPFFSTVDGPWWLTHDQKKCATDLFSLFDTNHNDRRCLELFARCLTYNTTSWGNECLLFQHDSYFTKVEKHPSV
jgi:N(6)-adenine-specific DNA methyltransferase